MNDLYLRIGGLLVRLWSSGGLSFQGLAGSYCPFVVDGEGKVDLEVEVQQAIPGVGRAQSAELALLRVAVDRMLGNTAELIADRAGAHRAQVAIGQKLLSSPGFLGTLQDYASGKGEWRSFNLSPSGASFFDGSTERVRLYLIRGHRDGTIHHLGGYLPSLLRLSLARHDGLLLHAAGIVNRQGAYIFMGPSGSGKTTIARAAKEKGWSVLADDGLIVRRMGDGQFRAFRTLWNATGPSWQGSFGDRPDSAPICAVFFHRHGKIDRWERLGPVAGSVRMVEAAFPVVKQLEDRDPTAALAQLADLSRETPCYDLWFSRHCGFLGQIKE